MISQLVLQEPEQLFFRVRCLLSVVEVDTNSQIFVFKVWKAFGWTFLLYLPAQLPDYIEYTSSDCHIRFVY